MSFSDCGPRRARTKNGELGSELLDRQRLVVDLGPEPGDVASQIVREAAGGRRARDRGTPTRLRTRLTFQRRTLKTSQRVAPSGSQTPGLTTGATPPAVHPRGPTGTPALRSASRAEARRYARVPPMDSGDEPLPMIKRGPFSMPMGGPFSTPIDSGAPCRPSVRQRTQGPIARLPDRLRAPRLEKARVWPPRTGLLPIDRSNCPF